MILDNNIEKVVLPEHASFTLDRFFKDIMFDPEVLNFSWIAGGFSRFLYKQTLKNEENNITTKVKINHLYEKLSNYVNFADIDVFSSTEKEVTNIQSSFYEKHKDDDFYYSNSLFSKNLNKFVVPKNEKSAFTGFDVKIQLVNKFFFSNIKECLSSFDITNCKFALSKESNNYVLTYHKKAKELEKHNLLHVANFDNIFLAQRLGKYMIKHDLSILKDDYFKENFNNYLYKILEDKCEYGLEKEEVDIIKERAVKSLHRNIKLSKNELILFLNMYSESQYERQGYGIYSRRKVDWAKKEIEES